MSAKTEKKVRKKVRKAYQANHDAMQARILADLEHRPDFALLVHYNAIKGIDGWWNRLYASLHHAWRLIDRSPVIKLRRKEANHGNA